MKETRVALRYAKSLISLAKERDVLEQVKEDMLTIKSVCEENEDFNNMLKSPVVKNDKKSVILNEIFGKVISETSLTFLNMLTDKKREAILAAVAENFISLYNEYKNIVSASVTTAAAITEDIRTEVLTQLNSIVGDAEVRVEENIDESIIGGFILRVGDLEFNASVANKLQKLKREFVSNPNIKA
jgi:F-type H+-transporting ATPase subunit delta